MADDFFVEPGFVEPGFVEIISPPPPVAAVLFVESDTDVRFLVPDPLIHPSSDPDDMTERQTPAITRKLGSLEPIVLVVRDGDGEPRDTTVWETAVLRARLRDRFGAVVINRTMDFSSPRTGGELEYDPVSGDFGNADTGFVVGEYDVQLRLTNADGEVEVYPQGGSLRIIFEEALTT